MYRLIFDNIDNDEKTEVFSPIIPVIGDYVKYESKENGEITGIVTMRDIVFKDGVFWAVDLSIKEE